MHHKEKSGLINHEFISINTTELSTLIPVKGIEKYNIYIYLISFTILLPIRI